MTAPSDWPEVRKRLEATASANEAQARSLRRQGYPDTPDSGCAAHAADIRLALSRADRIDALEAENARLREALEPFKQAHAELDPEYPDAPDDEEVSAVWGLTMGHFRRAAALSPPSAQERGK